MNLKDSDIKAYAEAKIKSAKEEIKKWQSVLEALGEVKDNSQLSFLPPEPAKPKPSKKLSILKKCQQALKQANCPLTSRDLMESINNLFPDRIYTMNSFSGAFSIAYRQPKSNIQVYDVKNASTIIKALYGLSEWFKEDGNFKEEYEKKVLDRYKVI